MALVETGGLKDRKSYNRTWKMIASIIKHITEVLQTMHSVVYSKYNSVPSAITEDKSSPYRTSYILVLSVIPQSIAGLSLEMDWQRGCIA